MSSPARHIARETGIALAVLAVYVLTLLLPLHQAAGLQRDFNALGFSTLDSWSVCQSLAADETGAPVEATALNCPAVGVGKHQLAVIMPPVLAVEDGRTILPARFAPEPGIWWSTPPHHVGQSRAPPVSV